MIEEYLATVKVDRIAENNAVEVVKLGVNGNFAFWITFVMILLFVPSFLIMIVKDRKDVKIYGIHGRKSLQQYTMFFFI